MLFPKRSFPRRRQNPSRNVLRTHINRRQAIACFEWLEVRRMLASVSWIGPATGYWDVAANWSNDAVPTASTAVVIATSGASGQGAPPTVTIQPGASDSAGSLSIAADATLSLSAGGDSTNPASNWIVNSGFESPVATNSTTPPGTWNYWGASYLSTQYAYAGLQSLVMSGTNSGASQTFAVTPGDSYTASIYAMMPVANPLTGTLYGDLDVMFYTSAGAMIGDYSPPNAITILTSASATGGPLTGSIGNQGWNHFYTTAVAPSNAATVQVSLGVYTYLGGATSGEVYFDDVTFGPAAGGASALAASSISNGGTLVVGAANTVTVSGAYAQSSTGALDIQLGGAPSSGNYGSLNVTGAATLAGTLEASIVNGYSPSTTDSFTPIQYASETGAFASETMPSGSGYQFNAAVTFTNTVFSAAPTTTLTATVNASTSLHAVTTNLLGINMVYWDSDTATAQTQQMVTAAGLDMYRFPGGSSADDFHFNDATNWDDSSAITIPQFVQAITADGGTGLVTLDYGSGSPQEAAAELAYLDGSPTDTTSIGSGIEWNDSASAWQTVNWGTIGYWASLRGAAPLAKDDGLNFMRIDHPAAFTDIKYWEVGNEEYGSWEVDHHGTAAGGASTGAQHDPATYAAFAAQFALLAGTILTDAGLPRTTISIGIDSGDPTGSSDDDWTKNVLADGLTDGFMPGFISDHSYMQAPGAESDSFLLNDTVSDSGSLLDWTTRYADYQAVLQQTLGSQASSVQVMATEFNSVYSNPGKQTTSLVNGLFVADSLGSLLDSGYTGAFVWDLRNSWDTGENNSNLLYGWREGGDYGQLGSSNDSSAPTTGPYIAYPGYYALQLASKIIQSGGQVVSAASNYSDLDVYAVKESSGDLVLLVVNVNPAANLTEQFDLTDFQPSGAAQVWQYGKTQDTAQSQSSSGASGLANFGTTLSLSGSDFSYTFPAYSMTVLDLGYSQVFTSLAISPSSSNLAAGGSQQFSATALDQYGKALTSQPAFTWSLTGGGSLTAGGLYTPPYASGTATVEATSNLTSATAAVTFSGEAQWVSTAAASWNASGAWESTLSGSALVAPGLRGIVGDTILLGPSATGTVELNGLSPSLGAITFSAPSVSTIAQGTGGSLLLNDGASPATITVSTGSDTISAPVGLGSNLLIDPAAGSTLDISGAISGTGKSLTVGQRGTVILSGVNSYTGGITVSAGTLIVTRASAIAGNASLTVGAGGKFIFDPDSADDSVVQSSTTAATPLVALPLSVSAIGPQTNTSRKSVPARALGTPDVERMVGSSIAKGTAGDAAWLGQAANSVDNFDQHHRKHAAMLALEAVFAQYGQ